MSIWEDFGFEKSIREILRSVKPKHQQPDHHFGRPFLTAYQIAIEYKKLYSDKFDQVGKKIGGQGTGEHTSLAQYIARELSQRIKYKKLDGFEGGFISSRHVLEFSFSDQGAKIESSLTDSECGLSMFRDTTVEKP